MSNLRIQPLDGGTRLAVFFASRRDAEDTDTKFWHPRPSRRPPPPLPTRALSAERAAPRRS